MDNQDGYFDEPAVARYDELSADMFQPAAVDPVVEVLAGLAGGGRALELGIGTGRIACPGDATVTDPQLRHHGCSSVS
jgi:hypothetical protein